METCQDFAHCGKPLDYQPCLNPFRGPHLSQSEVQTLTIVPKAWTMHLSSLISTPIPHPTATPQL